MKQLLAILVLGLLLVGCDRATSSGHKKALENCADDRSASDIWDQARWYQNQLTQDLTKETRKVYKQKYKYYKTLLSQKFHYKFSNRIYKPHYYRCEEQFDRNPTQFKARWK